MKVYLREIHHFWTVRLEIICGSVLRSPDHALCSYGLSTLRSFIKKKKKKTLLCFVVQLLSVRNLTLALHSVCSWFFVFFPFLPSDLYVLSLCVPEGILKYGNNYREYNAPWCNCPFSIERSCLWSWCHKLTVYVLHVFKHRFGEKYTKKEKVGVRRQEKDTVEMVRDVITCFY